MLLGISRAAVAQSWLPVGNQNNVGAAGNLGGLLPSAPREPAGQVVSRTAHPAVARIVVQEKTGVSYGSGTLIDVRGEYGLLITNWHVVRDSAGGSIYAFFSDGFQTPATIVKADKDWDLAALTIRKPPGVQPIAISRTAPKIGDWLCIAGYGSGDYRAAAGRCTQYVSPATNLPYEMVELGAEARQGDSGGPIFNERLELAGVLFGAARGTTSGSYCGRVLNFLQGVMPAAAEAPVAIPPAGQSDLATQLPAAPPPSTQPPAADAHLFAAAPPPTPHNEAPPLAIDTVVPVTDQARAAARILANQTSVETPPRQLMPLPARSAAPLTLVTGEEPLDDRTALRPTPNRNIDSRELAIAPRQEGPIAADALNVIHSLPSRVPNGAPLEATPADQLIAAAWKQIGGSTLFDQGKTLLAVLGLLGLLIQFWRLNSRPDPHDDD
ncbi:S1 family peptidase [Anatilimnocola floriformis]|uniref:S1 family peptidase n=1 Tax=Anatilimnocola floriformis TaxID=2948575 RepID=UPI0020C4E45F|nr:trypsin-like peptidase domain-containing protein [Anatilimnocola floriformis]